MRALSWNLFHGRDFPPESELLTWRSRLLGTTERGSGHAQVNVDLFGAFATLLARAEWDVALLQECPPRWAEQLAVECGAGAHLVLTSRNIPGLMSVQAALARRNPDLIASWEGGSNLTLVRDSGFGANTITERRSLRLATTPERREMVFTRLVSGLCVANLHASADQHAAESELIRAGHVARGWAGGSQLVFGGDLNLRPVLSPSIFGRLERECGLTGATGPRVIDHILGAGITAVGSTTRWDPELREILDPTATATSARLPIRLSDHAPVEAMFETGVSA